MHGYFKQQTKEIAHKMSRTWLWIGNLKRETESLNSITKECHKNQLHQGKIDNTQKNRKSRLCGDRDKTVNPISKSSKLARKEYKTKYDPLRIVQDIKIWPCWQIQLAQTRICPRKSETQNSSKQIQMDPTPKFGQKIRSSIY